MELIKKDYPIDFEYTIKISRNELAKIRDYIDKYYYFRRIDPTEKPQDDIYRKLNEILEIN
jgi:hypothetical protein